MKKSKPPKTHFVPKIVFEATFAGVIPLCVAAAACGSETANNTDSGQDAAGRDAAVFLGVAAIGFDGGVADAFFSVAAIGFDAPHYTDSVAADAFGDVPFLSVAAIGFDTGIKDVGVKGPDAADSGDAHETGFSVADAGFRPPDGSAG